MKKILTIILTVIMALFIFCGCEEDVPTVSDQTGNLKYEVAEGWDALTVSPSPSNLKVYEYADYTARIEALSYYFYEDPLQEALDYALGAVLQAEYDEAGYHQDLVSAGMVGEMPAKEVAIESTDLDGTFKFMGVFTAIETDSGLYTVSTITTSEEQKEAVKEVQRKLKESIEYVTDWDPEVYTENVLQFTDYICAVPGADNYVIDTPWWTERKEYEDCVIGYVFGRDLSSLKVIPMDKADLTDDVIVSTLESVYDGSRGPEAECSISGRQMMEADTGSALYVEIDLKFGEEADNTAKASSVFVMDENGHAICCFTNTADSDLSYDYTAITNSIQESDAVYKTIDSLYENSTEYIGDNTAVISLMNDLEFGWYGDYTIELHTDKEPYGMTVNYKDDVENYDFQREAVMMIALVGNMDYIKIKDINSDIVQYDYELTKGLMRYDVKKMAKDKARLACYYLETLY